VWRARDEYDAALRTEGGAVRETIEKKNPSEGEPLKTMKKLGIATALVLTLAFGAGSVFAQNSNSSTTGGNMSAKHSRRHHRRMMRRHHRRHHHKAANANT
jgi:Na+/phosphate symporter